MNLLDYAVNMHWKQVEMLQLNLASKIGFHSLTQAVSVVIFTGPPKWPTVCPWQMKRAEICNALVGLCFLYGL